ncbi:hypothetical protein AAG906_020646 [Vitis piasezkii]
MVWDDFDGLPVASLPAKFRMPEIERYTGIGCPRIHLRLYSTVMRAHGLDEAQMIMLFPMSLSGAAQRWFASLDVSRRRTWDDLAQEFLRQFAFNTVIDVSRRELEALRPSERDQISMIMKSLRPQFARHLMGFPHVDFGSLMQALYGIEEVLLETEAPQILSDSWTDFWSLLSAITPCARLPAHYPQPRAPPAPRPVRQFSQLGMPLSRAFQKLMEGGLLTALAPRPPPQPLPPQFRMDLHCAYHRDQGLVNLGQPSVTMNPLPAHTTHSVPPPTGGIHHMDFVQDDVIHMLSWDDGLPEMIVPDDGYEIASPAAPPLTAPFGGTDSQIRVETSTTPEGLIHMMTADRATCIVFSADDLPPEGSDHNCPLYITVVCSGHRVSSVLLDNGSALNVCPLATAIALGFAPSDFGPSTQTVMGTLTIDLLIGPTTFSILFQVLRIPASFNLLLGRPWIHQAGAIPSSLHQKVKFIHDGQVITVQSTRDMISSSEPRYRS